MTIAIPDLTRILCGDAESGRAPVVVVSGATAGLGQFVPAALARRGCRVARLARSRTELVQSAVADVSDQKAVTRAFQRISVGLGPVRILIAGAAIYPRHEVLTQPDAPVQEVPAVNLGGQVNCDMAALAQMVPMGKGVSCWLATRPATCRCPAARAIRCIGPADRRWRGRWWREPRRGYRGSRSANGCRRFWRRGWAAPMAWQPRSPQRGAPGLRRTVIPR